MKRPAALGITARLRFPKLHLLVLVQAGAIAAWAAFLGWLWVTGAAVNYVGPRTSWVVPFGLLVLSLAAVGRLRGLVAASEATQPSHAQIAGLGALLTPLLAVILVPAPSLGALAVHRKSSSLRAAGDPLPVDSEIAAFGAEARRANATRALTMPDLALADREPVSARYRGVRPGARIEVTGFVSATGPSAAEGFDLSRFQTFCCAGRRRALHRPRGRPAARARWGAPITDTWLTVSGRIARAPGGGYRLDASRVVTVPVPANP